MNLIARIITYVPNLSRYLKGTQQFNEQNFENALSNFEKCLKHKDFQNELVFSYYGQSLCAIDQLEEAYPFLIRAYEIYENQGWEIKNEVSHDVAVRTLSALIHIKENTSLEIDEAVFEKEKCLTIK
jgi:tetratricopeptide (TPR) repeat protein